MNLVFLLFVLLSPLVKSQDENVENKENVDNNVDLENSYFAKSHPLRDSKDLLALDLKESEDVKTSSKIIQQHNESLLYYLGDNVEILLGFENIGEKDLYITDVCGALVSPHDNTVFVFNNTAVHHNITAKKNEYHSFYYPFPINPHSNPIDYGVVAFIYYVNGRGDEYRSVVVNETLVLKDAPSAIKAGKFFLIVLVIIVVVAVTILFRKQIVVFFVNIYNRIAKKSSGRKGSGGRRSGARARSAGEGAGAGAEEEDEADEWLKHTSTHAFQKNEQRQKDKEKEKKSTRGKRNISSSPDQKTKPQ